MTKDSKPVKGKNKKRLSSSQVWAIMQLKTQHKIADIGIIHVRTKNFLIRYGIAKVVKGYVYLTKMGKTFKS